MSKATHIELEFLVWTLIAMLSSSLAVGIAWGLRYAVFAILSELAIFAVLNMIGCAVEAHDA